MTDVIEQMTIEHIPLVYDFNVIDEEGIDYFKNYLMTQALQDQKDGYANVQVLVREEDNGQKKLLGFYAIRCSSLIIDNMDNGERLGEPAIEILELAVHKDFQRQGIGSNLMKDIFNKAKVLNDEHIGVRHLLVCAKSTAVPFYEIFKMKKLIIGKIPRNFDNQDCIGMSVRLAYPTETGM